MNRQNGMSQQLPAKTNKDRPASKDSLVQSSLADKANKSRMSDKIYLNDGPAR
ncbi:MAG: hypothetical protein GXY36_14965 [Chloroflexi bacterium]|nr:hypothetical protein [Chloroflexota bacterium]